MIKPDGVRKNIIGEIILRFESRGLKILAMKLVRLSREKADELYSVHREKSFFQSLVDFVLTGPVVVMVLGGNNVVTKVRDIMGATNPQEASPGSIRADFGEAIEQNIVHGADSEENARREIELFFGEKEIME